MMRLPLTLLLLATTTAIHAQGPERPDRRDRVVVPPQNRPSVRVTPRDSQPLSQVQPAQPQPPARPSGGPSVPPLSGNVILAFEGSFGGNAVMNIALTGCGPRFVADLVLPAPADSDMPPPVITIEAVIREQGEAYQVECQVGARIAVVAGESSAPGGRVGRSIEFRNMTLSSTVLAKPGRPIVLSKVGERALTLSVTRLE